MSERIRWQRTDTPQRFTADLPGGGTAELWHQAGGQTTSGWHWRMRIGETLEAGVARERQQASDEANRMLPGVLARERARVAKLEAKAELHRRLEAAYAAGGADVMAFAPRAAEREELLEIMDFLRRRGWLDGPLQPLREAVSAELYRRRVEGR